MSGQQALSSMMQQGPDLDKPPAPAVRALVQLDMAAPMIVIPEDIYNPATPCIAVDLGAVRSFSRLV